MTALHLVQVNVPANKGSVALLQESRASKHPLLVFRIDAQKYGLDLNVVDRVIPVIEISPLPAAPDFVLGVITVAGTLLPVLDLRKKFGLPERELKLSDQIILASWRGGKLGLLVDEVEGITEVADLAIRNAEQIYPGIEQLKAVANIHGELLFIQDLERAFSPQEEKQYEEAIKSL